MKIQLTIVRLAADSCVWDYTGPAFEIGRNPDCTLCIASESSQVVAWNHAKVMERNGEVFVTDLKSVSGTYVNGKRIVAIKRIVQGDEIGLGEKGPRLRVDAICVDSPTPQVNEIASPTPSAASAPLTKEASTTSALRSSAAAAAAGSSVATKSVDRAEPLIGESHRNQRQFTTMLIASVAVLLVASVGGVALWTSRLKEANNVALVAPSDNTVVPQRDEPTKPVTVPPPRPAEKPVDLPPKNTNDKPLDKRPDQPVEKPMPIAPPNPPIPLAPATPPDPWATAQASVAESVFMILVEEPKSGAMWGMANATALSDTHLLTNGLVAIELAKVRKKGRNIYAVRKSLGERTAISTILIQAGAQSDLADQQIYFDYALLVASTPLVGTPAKLGSAPEIAALEQGTLLATVGIVYGEDPVDRFQRMEPQLFPSKVFAITRFASEPGSPQLGHIRGKFADKPVGCPLINDQGHVVGVYADSEMSAPNATQLQIHYVPILTPAIIELGLNSQPNQVWIEPNVSDSKGPTSPSTAVKK